MWKVTALADGVEKKGIKDPEHWKGWSADCCERGDRGRFQRVGVEPRGSTWMPTLRQAPGQRCRLVSWI